MVQLLRLCAATWPWEFHVPAVQLEHVGNEQTEEVKRSEEVRKSEIYWNDFISKRSGYFMLGDYSLACLNEICALTGWNVVSSLTVSHRFAAIRWRHHSFQCFTALIFLPRTGYSGNHGYGVSGSEGHQGVTR